MKVGVFGAQLLSPEVFVSLAHLAVLQRNLMLGAEGFDPPRKISRHSSQTQLRNGLSRIELIPLPQESSTGLS